MTTTKKCSVKKCKGKTVARGLCKTHYRLVRRDEPKSSSDKCRHVYANGKECVRSNQCSGYCNAHYQRLTNGSDMDAPFRERRDEICKHVYKDGKRCDKPNKSTGFCSGHYARLANNIDMDAPWKKRVHDGFCKHVYADGSRCTNKHSAKGYCSGHWHRVKSGINLDLPWNNKIPNYEDLSLENVYTKVSWHKRNNPGSRGDGYVSGYVMKNGKRSHYRQHRLVWELHHGRELREFENIHHINGIRSDNRIENLQLWAKAQPIGQRPEDLVEWVLDNYPDLVSKRYKKAKQPA